MGLDMYLRKEFYIAAKYEHRKVKAKVDITIDGKPIKVDPKKIYSITEDVGYWRKSNQIHKWFVDNVQGGKDDCESYDVGYEDLLKLKELCEKVLKTKDTSLLPPQSGFFFGSTEIDEGYFEDLKYTVKMIEDLDPEGDYIYRSSW